MQRMSHAEFRARQKLTSLAGFRLASSSEARNRAEPGTNNLVGVYVNHDAPRDEVLIYKTGIVHATENQQTRLDYKDMLSASLSADRIEFVLTGGKTYRVPIIHVKGTFTDVSAMLMFMWNMMNATKKGIE